MASLAVLILYLGLFFDIESENAQVKLNMSQKYRMASFKLYDVKLVLWPKDAQISESDFGKLQKVEIFL